MSGRAGQPFLSPQDVANLHHVVVYHDRQMIGGEPVGLEDNKVVQQLILPLHGATNQVVDSGGAGGRHGEPHH